MKTCPKSQLNQNTSANVFMPTIQVSRFENLLQNKFESQNLPMAIQTASRIHAATSIAVHK